MAAAGKNGGCKVQGTWIGFDNGVPTWVSSSHGQSASSGTNELEYPAFAPENPGTELRGVWKRTRGNTFAYTMFGYAYDDATGLPIWMNKMSGTLTLSEDCNSAEVTAIVNIFICYDAGDWVCQDPFEDEPFQVINYPTTYAKRLMVE
jgi:hypothetical protein